VSTDKKIVLECNPKWRGMLGVYDSVMASRAYSKIKMSDWTIRVCHNESCDCGDQKSENRCRRADCRAWGVFVVRIKEEYIELCPTCSMELIKKLGIKIPKRKPKIMEKKDEKKF
jgi:hypothetical protein